MLRSIETQTSATLSEVAMSWTLPSPGVKCAMIEACATPTSTRCLVDLNTSCTKRHLEEGVNTSLTTRPATLHRSGPACTVLAAASAAGRLAALVVASATVPSWGESSPQCTLGDGGISATRSEAPLASPPSDGGALLLLDVVHLEVSLCLWCVIHQCTAVDDRMHNNQWHDVASHGALP